MHLKELPMYYNYHMHCDFSDDSKTPMKDMIKQILSTAIYDEKGIEIILLALDITYLI